MDALLLRTRAGNVSQSIYEYDDTGHAGTYIETCVSPYVCAETLNGDAHCVMSSCDTIVDVCVDETTIASHSFCPGNEHTFQGITRSSCGRGQICREYPEALTARCEDETGERELMIDLYWS